MPDRSEAGFALLDILFVVAIIGLLSSLAMPSLIRSKQAADVASAVGSLRVINSAQLSYAITCGGGFYAPDLTSLARVPPGTTNGFISPDLGAANVVQKAGFRVEVAATPNPASPAGCSGVAAGQGATGYRAGADSINPAVARFFGTNASGTIFEANVALFPVMPEVAPPPVGVPIQ